MAKKIALGVVLILAAALLQSILLSRLVIYIHAIPDLALCILVFIAYTNGTMTGQLTGFFSGFVLDFLSASPLGLNAFVRTIIGALSGFIKDTFYLDIFFLPMVLCAAATALKASIFFLLHIFFPDAVPVYSLQTLTFWIEIGLNTLLAPLIFGFLKLFRPIYPRRRENA